VALAHFPLTSTLSEQGEGESQTGTQPSLLCPNNNASYHNMRRLGVRLLITGCLAFGFSVFVLGADTVTEPPDFKEIYELVRAHARGVTPVELDRAAANALVSALAPKVMLVGDDANSSETARPLAKVTLFEGDLLYFRIERVAVGLAEALRKEYATAGKTNKLKGLVLDLRYATGQDYAAAADAADVFMAKERPLLSWGSGSARSKEKPDLLVVPLAVLVNHQTSGSAEALAAIIRETGAGLILGIRTAGQAAVAEEFPLKNGQRLRIATGPVQLGDGTALSPEGVNPDIAVSVAPQDERTYYADTFGVAPGTNFLALANLSLTNQANGTDRSRRTRINEAELVRERRDRPAVETGLSGVRENEPEKPSIRDPALARALDLLKGLAVVRHSRS